MRVNLYVWFVAIFLITSFSGCKKGCTDELALNFDEKAKSSDGSCVYSPVRTAPKITLNFNLLAKDQTLVYDKFYTDYNQRGMAIETFRFYISDITLVDKDGKSHVLSEVELVDFNPADTLWKNNFTYNIPQLTQYKQLKFGIGVKPELNLSNPADFEVSHPLSIYPGMYWTWATKYIFAKVEGKIDLNNDNAADQAFFYHIGLDKYFKNVEPLSINLTPELNINDTLNLKLDAMYMFYHPADTIDYQVDGQTHTDDNEVLADRLLTNLSKSFFVVEIP